MNTQKKHSNDFHLIVRHSSTDPRDAGAGTERILGRNPDGEDLRRVAKALTAVAAAGYDAFHEGPYNRDQEERQAARQKFEDEICRWFPVKLNGDEVTFHVVEVPTVPLIDLSKFDVQVAA